MTSIDKETKRTREYNLSIPVVFAEDDPVDQEMILRAVKKTIFTNGIHFVKDGYEALEYVNSSGQYNWQSKFKLPVVIFLDIRMPKMNGLEVLKRIKGNEQTKNIPVIIFTSSTADIDCRESYKFGANSFIIKPFNFDDFQQTVVDMVNYWVLRNRPIEN